MPTPQSATPASSWRSVEGFVAELPSGNSARIKRTMDILTMVKQGRIPNPLAGIVMEAIRSKGTMDLDLSAMPAEAIPQMFSMIDDVAIGCMLEPRVERPYYAKDDSEEEQRKETEWQPSEGAISLAMLDEMDKMYLFRVAMGGATDLESFRAALESGVATAQDGAGVQPATKSSARARKR